MVFQCIDIRQVPREMKTAVFGLGYQHLPRDLANVNAWKTMFDPHITCNILFPQINNASLSIFSGCLRIISRGQYTKLQQRNNICFLQLLQLRQKDMSLLYKMKMITNAAQDNKIVSCWYKITMTTISLLGLRTQTIMNKYWQSAESSGLK